MCWNDLGTKDLDGAARFYAELFGWTLDEPLEDDPTQHRTIRNGGKENGSMYRQGEEEAEVPPNWLPYFATADLAASLENLGGLGGQVIVPTLEVPAGKLAVVTDPQDAPFGLFAGSLDA
jgi:predicted enzyme related to lactoylglutathione lyase